MTETTDPQGTPELVDLFERIGLDRPVRVAYLAPNLHPGGAERQMLLLATALPRPMFDVRFMVLLERGAFAVAAEEAGVPVHTLALPRERAQMLTVSGLQAGFRAVRRYVRLTKTVDVVDAWLMPAYTFAGLAQPVARVPILLAGRRHMLDAERTRNWYRDSAARVAMRMVHGVVANSSAAADQAVTVEHIAPERVHVIHNAVVRLATPPDQRSRVRDSWGFDDEHVVIGCVGNFLPGKGHDMLLDVASQVLGRQPRVRYVLVGDGPLRPWLEREIDRRGLLGVVVLHSGESDARRLYVAFDICAQASDSEGLPNAVLEAASVGLPIVATDVGGTREIVAADVDALLVQRRDGRAFADAITRLAGDPELRDRLGANARARSLDFSQEALVLRTAALYMRSLAAVRRTRPHAWTYRR